MTPYKALVITVLYCLYYHREGGVPWRAYAVASPYFVHAFPIPPPPSIIYDCIGIINILYTLCLQCRYRHRNLSVIVPVSPYKILHSYVALVPAPSCIRQYKFVHKFAGTLDTAYYIICIRSNHNNIYYAWVSACP